MELFGIGIFEVILIVLIAMIILGPQDTIITARNFGRAVRRFFSSPEWRSLLQASSEIRNIPDKILEETGLDHPEEILPSEAEIRKEAGLDDLAQNMAEWGADLTALKNTGQAPSEPQPGQILPPGKEVSQPAGLDDREQGLPEQNADLSAWGSSTVLIPTPQSVPTIQPTSEPASPAQDQPETEPPAQESASSTSPEQEKT